jgi:hypothetical protein
MKDIYFIRDMSNSIQRKLRCIIDAVLGIHKSGIYSDVEITVFDKHGVVKSHTLQNNLRTNVGSDFWNTQLFTTAPGANGANYLALSTDATAPSVTDTVLSSELAVNGLNRVQVGAPTHVAGSSSTTISNTFTYTGSVSTVVAKAALFNAASVGSMVLETLLASTATVNSNGDQVVINWTVNY